jgi:hypothetical protein
MIPLHSCDLEITQVSGFHLDRRQAVPYPSFGLLPPCR